jgi:glycogen debranching enzyme
VDSLTSNIGHLPWSGLLDEAPVAFPTASRPQAWAAGTPLLLLSTLLDLHPGSTDADIEVPYGIGHLALRTQRD